MAKQFAPHIYRDWLPLFATLPSEQAAEVLKGIAGYPDYEVKGVPLWSFFKTQLDKEYETFCERIDKARGSASVRWSNANVCESEIEAEPAQNKMQNNANICERIQTHTTQCERTEPHQVAQNKMQNNAITEQNNTEQNSNPLCISPLGEKPKRKRAVFVAPNVDEVNAYIAENGFSVDAQRFVDFYASKGWVVGKSAMKDWKACIRRWESDKKDAIRKGTVVSFGVKSGSYSEGVPL